MDIKGLSNIVNIPENQKKLYETIENEVIPTADQVLAAEEFDDEDEEYKKYLGNIFKKYHLPSTNITISNTTNEEDDEDEDEDEYNNSNNSNNSSNSNNNHLPVNNTGFSSSYDSSMNQRRTFNSNFIRTEPVTSRIYSHPSIPVENPNSKKNQYMEELGKSIGNVSVEDGYNEYQLNEIYNMNEFLLNSFKSAGVEIKPPYNTQEGKTPEQLIQLNKILTSKDAFYRSLNFGREGLESFSRALEYLFDGKKTYLGKYAPNYSGCSSTIAYKVRNMQPQIASLSYRILKFFGEGSILTVLIELLPTLLLYPVTKKSTRSSNSEESGKSLEEKISQIYLNH